MLSYNAPDLEDFSSDSINDIVSYCEENRDNVNFYRVTGPIDHWITAVEKKVWGFSSESDYESVEEGDVLLFHATNNAANSDLTAKKSGIIGVGVVSKKRTKDEPWWWAEHREGDEWQYIVEFEPMLITGSPEDIDRSKEITEKTLNEIEKETFALLQNFMPMSRAGEICNEINGKDFPTMGSRSGFRDQNGDIDTEAPIKIIREIKSSLNNVDSPHDTRRKLSDVDNDIAGEVPEKVKTQLEKMVQNSENNQGSFTRLYGVKAYFDLNRHLATDEELKESVKKNYEEKYPGSKSSYLQNRHKAFQRDEYAAFQEIEDGYQLKSEYEDYRSAIKSYVDRLWGKSTSNTNYFVVSHNSKENQFKEEYLQAPYTEDSEDYEGSYQPSHDLSKINKGDKILHYKNKHFVGLSEAEKEPDVVESDEEGKKFYLDVDIRKFENPRSLAQVRDFLRKEKKKVDKYYVLNSEGGKSEGYLKKITREGFDYMISGDHELEIQVGEDLSADLDLNFEDLYFPEGEEASIRSQIRAALNSGKHIIFTGPPGTGKTELAEKIAREMKDSDSNVTGFQLTTATSDWSTFDTVGGYRPEDDGSLEFKPGHILRRFKDDEKDLKNEALVIDEINRANIDKAFGQLFTVLSGQKVQLPFTKGEKEKEVEVVPGGDFEKPVEDHEFVVPESWRILATMNTYDKTSLYEMSYAFMRRFSFIRVEAPEIPEEGQERARLLDNYIEAWGMNVQPDPAENVGEIWYRVNNAVDGREIGPAIAKDMLNFLDESGTDEASNTAAITNYIFPQLEGVPDRKKIVESLADADISLDEQRLKRVAKNMLQVDLSGEE